MPTVRDILGVKGNYVYTIAPTVTVLEAVRKMNEQKIGALVVMQGHHVVGMFTERDVLIRVVGEQADPSATKVASVMTQGVLCCDPDTDLDDISTIMKNRRVRHLPVCDGDGQIKGLISIGDVNAFNASNQEAIVHSLSDYIYGRV